MMKIPQLFKANSKQREEVSFHQGKIDVSDQVKLQLSMIDLQEEDLAIIKGVQPYIAKHIETIVDQFYKNLSMNSQLTKTIDTHSSFSRLKSTLRKHIEEMFEGTIDQAFIDQRITIARVHVKIGLDTKWYMCAFQDLLQSIGRVLEEEIAEPNKRFQTLLVVSKILNIEQQLVLEAYEVENQRIRNEGFAAEQALKGKVSGTSEELAALSQETSASIDDLRGKVKDVVDFSRSGAESSGRVDSLSKEGQLKLGKQYELIKTIRNHMEEISSEIESLKDMSEKINRIVTIVQSIADQTNLLALNAGIEAARAGDAGRGFNVVAKEVRKLAEQTKVSVSDVSGLVAQTKVRVGTVSEYAQKIDGLVETSNGGLSEANEFFTHIVGETERAREQNSNVEKELSFISAVIDEMNEAVHQLAVTADHLNDETNTL